MVAAAATAATVAAEVAAGLDDADAAHAPRTYHPSRRTGGHTPRHIGSQGGARRVLVRDDGPCHRRRGHVRRVHVNMPAHVRFQTGRHIYSLLLQRGRFRLQPSGASREDRRWASSPSRTLLPLGEAATSTGDDAAAGAAHDVEVVGDLAPASASCMRTSGHDRGRGWVQEVAVAALSTSDVAGGKPAARAE